MKYIDEVDIKNYKGFSEMAFSCNSINIIVGPNNTGKSSVLESIWIGISSLNEYTDLMENDFDDAVSGSGYNYLIHNNDANLKAEISLKLHNSKNIKVILDYCKNGLPDGEKERSIFMDYIDSLTYSSIPSVRFGSAYDNVRRSGYRKLNEIIDEISFLKERRDEDFFEAKISQLYNLLTDVSEDMENELQSHKQRLIKAEKLFVYPETYSENSVLLNKYFLTGGSLYAIVEHDSNNFEIPLLLNKHSLSDDLFYEKILKSKKIIEVIDYLKSRIPYFEDFRESEGIQYVFVKDVDKPLPLPLMGDGFKALLVNSFITTLIEKGVVLFEEPEVHLHPGYLSIFAKEIVDNSKNHQIFLSTHSLELIEYILRSAEKSGVLNEVNILKLSRFYDGFIEREIINGTHAKEEMEEICTDLRGA